MNLNEMKNLEDELELKSFEEDSDSCGEVISNDTSLIEVEDATDTFQEEIVENRREDYNCARENLKNALKVGSESLEDLLEIAKASQSPRAYEVISTMVKNVSEASDKLMDIQKKLEELEISSDSEKSLKNLDKLELTQNTQNTIYVGSTADLQQLIQESMGTREITPINKTEDKIIDISTDENDE